MTAVIKASKIIAIQKPNQLFLSSTEAGCLKEVNLHVKKILGFNLTEPDFSTYWKHIYEKDQNLQADIQKIRKENPDVTADHLIPYLLQIQTNQEDDIKRAIRYQITYQ